MQNVNIVNIEGEISVDKEWTLEEAKKDYKERCKSCKHCKFAHKFQYVSCEVRDIVKKIHYPKLKARFCKYYTR